MLTWAEPVWSSWKSKRWGCSFSLAPALALLWSPSNVIQSTVTWFQLKSSRGNKKFWSTKISPKSVKRSGLRCQLLGHLSCSPAVTAIYLNTGESDKSRWLCGPTRTPALPFQQLIPGQVLAWTPSWCWMLPKPQKASAAQAENCEQRKSMELWRQ